MGEWGAACAILILACVTSWGAQSGDRGGGGVAWSWWCFFSDVAPFFGRERPGRREKQRLDLKMPQALSEGNPRYWRGLDMW